MIEHFDANLNIRKLILDLRPQVVVECGAGSGETSRALAYMRVMIPFELHIISDKELDIDEVEWHTGLSYNVLKEFKDESLDLVFLDTDHNYWTLKQELLALIPKMKTNGLIVMHDVEEFYHDSGMALSYWNDAPYPKAEIENDLKLGGLGDCLMDFLVSYKHKFKLERFIPESHGMAVIKRVDCVQAKVYTPGPNPLYAKPVIANGQ